ncbi:MAG: hypothetical protein OCD00_08605 [Colwellia sp.]
MQFNEHGHYQLESDGNIIFYRITGSWNYEASVSCIKDINQCFEEIDNQPVMMIVDTIDFEGSLNEGYLLWSEATVDWLKRNLTHFIRIDNVNTAHYKLFVARMDAALKEKTTFNLAHCFDEAIQKAHALGFSGFETSEKS